MKTLRKNLFSVCITAIILATTFSFASASKIKEPQQKTSSLKTFRKIAVNGNVQITVIQNGKEGIAYADDSFGEAKVTQYGDLITISPAGNDVAKIIVYVKDVYRITGNDDAIINTDGVLRTTFLQLFLKGNATAKITTTTSGLYTILADSSKLDLSGKTIDHTLNKSAKSILNMQRFAALKTEINKDNRISATQQLALIK